MSDKDQSDESTYNDLSSGPAGDSAQEDSAGEPESELPSFGAYGDDEEWSALDDDESLSGDPEWTGDNLAALEPNSPEESDMPPPADARHDTDSQPLFEDDEFEDETVSLSTDDEYLTDSRANRSSTTADFADEALAGKHDDQHEDDDGHEDDDYEEDDYEDDDDDGSASATPVPSAAQSTLRKPNKTRWIWPTVAAVLGLSAIGTGGYGWFHAMEQSKTIRSLEFQLKAASQVATVEPVVEQSTLNNERIDELQKELSLARERHADEISELAEQNQTLNAKLSSTERALLQAKKDNTPAPAAPDKTSPQKAQNSTAPSGNWFINIQTFSEQTDAAKLAASLFDSPENIQVQSVSVNGKTLYRVRAEGYADKAEADAAAETLVRDFGLSKPWIGRQDS
ncbi:SPOR domain-containing protein [Luminiphilus sp.]|nr:SPOR domain-containing protein [Luminiphilus sp.]